jgi:hypothetical protein
LPNFDVRLLKEHFEGHMSLAEPVSGEEEERATFGSTLSVYYFDFDDGRQALSDKLGTEFANLEAVADQAVVVLAEIVRDNRSPSVSHRVAAVSVRNSESRVIFKATLTLQSEWL